MGHSVHPGALAHSGIPVLSIPHLEVTQWGAADTHRVPQLTPCWAYWQT